MDKHVYIDTYFRVESGYDGGRMPEEKSEAFFTEVKRLFAEQGFSIEERRNGCPDVFLDKTRLYCHPQSLSGPVLEQHIKLVEEILHKGTTFRYLRTDTYGEILDLTEEEELAYYHEIHDMTIKSVFRDAFRTKRRNLYKRREKILEIFIEKLHVKTLREKSVYTSSSPAWRYILEIYRNMVSEGELIEAHKETAFGSCPLCRTANDKEMKIVKQKIMERNNEKDIHP